MLTNNDIMKKLRVALKLRDTEIIEILDKADFPMTSSELSAIFRSEDHPNYKECGDQLLRNFLNGLIIHLRGPMPEKPVTHNESKQKPNSTAHSHKPDRQKSLKKPGDRKRRD